jgi:acetyl-CoA acetyltransferase
MDTLKNKAAIVGLGATEFSKSSGRSELQLAVEAVTAAVADAGLDPADVDGLCTFTLDNNTECEVFRNIGGRELKFFSRIGYGGGGVCGPLQQAMMAVASGVASVVVCYRAMNERSGLRVGQPTSKRHNLESEMAIGAYHALHGLQTAAASLGISMRRYMYETGATSEDFANISIAARRHAARNPNAFFFGAPITRDEYMSSRMIADPFRLLDCCQESDGAVAIVVTTAERARSLKQRPVLIRAAAQGAAMGTINSPWGYYQENIVRRDESQVVARQLYASSGIQPNNVQVAIIYDHFGPTVLPSLEAYGFCKQGDAKEFIKDGNIELGGGLPINTHGGQLGEAYMHGMNGVAEAVRQLRGTACNQVSGVEHVLVTGGSGLPTSGAILGI